MAYLTTDLQQQAIMQHKAKMDYARRNREPNPIVEAERHEQEKSKYSEAFADAKTDAAVDIWRACAESPESAGTCMLEVLNIPAESFAEMIVHLSARDRLLGGKEMIKYIEDKLDGAVYKQASIKATSELEKGFDHV